MLSKKSYHSFFTVAVFTFIVAMSGRAFAGELTKQDGKFFFEAMKSSIIQTMKEYPNAADKAKNEIDQQKELFQKAYNKFIEIAGPGFSPRSLVGNRNISEITSVLAQMVLGSRETISNVRDTAHYAESKVVAKTKNMVPTAISKDQIKRKIDAVIQQTRRVKNGYGSINYNNMPEGWERKVLENFSMLIGR